MNFSPHTLAMLIAIGLIIAKTWVEAHGGEIHAESAGEGKGSRFWFTLPTVI